MYESKPPEYYEGQSTLLPVCDTVILVEEQILKFNSFLQDL